MFSKYYYELRSLHEPLKVVTITFIKRNAKELHTYERRMYILFTINYYSYIHCGQREQRIIFKLSLQHIVLITTRPTVYNDAGYFIR